jgi:hypothetical protein
LENEIQDVWEKDVMLGLGLRADYGLVHDDLASRQVMYSFTADERNKVFVNNRATLLRAILSEPALHQRFVAFQNGGIVRWHYQTLRSWLAAYARFEGLLLLYAQITSGSPGRGTELTAMLLVNTELYPQRNLVAFGSHISFLCTYLKTSGITNSDKLLPHSLTAFCSDILIQDLSLARPFARMAAKLVHSNNEEIANLFDSHVFVNHTKLFDTDDISNGLRTKAAAHMDVDLNVSNWRHIYTAFRRKLCSQLQDLLEGDENERIEALQMGHNTQTERRIYGISPEALQSASEDVLPLFLDASTEWQILCGVVPGGITLPYSAAKMDSFKQLASKKMFKVPQESEVKVLLHTLLNRIDRLVDERLLNRIDLLETRLALNNDTVPSAPLIEHHSEESAHDNTIERRSEESVPDLSTSALHALRHLLTNPRSMWKSPEQEAAVMAALKGDRDVLAILPTGSGKSMIALVPAYLEKDKVTVLILPLRVLLLDYKRKLTKMGIAFDIYESGRPLSGTKSLVLVSADSVRSDSWKEAIAAVHCRRPVVRQIIDEAHIPLLSQDFRHRLRHMSDIRCNIPSQLILLTASASPRMAESLLTEFCLGPQTVILRAPSNRPELAFTWRRIEESKLLGFVGELLVIHLKEPQDRAIIFVQTYADGEAIAAALSLPFYHGGDTLTNDDREKIYSYWQDGNPVTCIATSAFGTGNDYAHVRLVIHAGFSSEMTNYTQEAARAGRDGRPAACYMLQHMDLPNKARIPLGDPDLQGRRDILAAFSAAELCIRYSVTAFVDGKGVYCSSDPSNQLCNRCLMTKKARSVNHLFWLMFVEISF